MYARGRANGTDVKWSVMDPAAMDADRSIMSSIQYNITVNAALIEVEKDLREGLISIQMFSWVSFLTMVLGAIAGTFQWQITVSVTSFKSTHIFSTDISEQYELF